MPILIPNGTLDYNSIKNALAVDGNCTHLAGHCYGSDGGSGIPSNLKVTSGRGGNYEVWKITGNTIDAKEMYTQCQYCLKYLYVETIK